MFTSTNPSPSTLRSICYGGRAALSPFGRREGVISVRCVSSCTPQQWAQLEGVLPKGWSAGCLNPQPMAGGSGGGISCPFVSRAAAAWDKPRSVSGPVLLGNTPLTLPPERRPPARQVLHFSQKRAGPEIGAHCCYRSRGQCVDTPCNNSVAEVLGVRLSCKAALPPWLRTAGAGF